jgi:hypothetical protein
MQDTKVEAPVSVEGGSTPTVPETTGTIEGGVTTRRGTKTHRSRSRSRSRSKRCPKGSIKETRKGRSNKCRSKSSVRRKYHRHSSKSRALMGVRKLYSRRCPKGEVKDRRIPKHRNASGCRKKMSGGSVAEAIAQAVAAPAVVTQVQA